MFIENQLYFYLIVTNRNKNVAYKRIKRWNRHKSHPKIYKTYIQETRKHYEEIEDFKKYILR